MVLGSDWFSASVIRTLKQARYRNYQISQIKAAAPADLVRRFSRGKKSRTEYEQYIYKKKIRPLFPLACENLQIPLEEYSHFNGSGTFQT